MRVTSACLVLRMNGSHLLAKRADSARMPLMTRLADLKFDALANAVLKSLVGKEPERLICTLWSSDGRSGPALEVVT